MDGMCAYLHALCEQQPKKYAKAQASFLERAVEVFTNSKVGCGVVLLATRVVVFICVFVNWSSFFVVTIPYLVAYRRRLLLPTHALTRFFKHWGLLCRPARNTWMTRYAC